MSHDEAGTLAALKTQRSELIEQRIAKYNGRVVKLMGDGLLAEFSSVVEAVGCAIEIQREIALHPHNNGCSSASGYISATLSATVKTPTAMV